MPSNEKTVQRVEFESAGILPSKTYTTGEVAYYCGVSQQNIIREIEKPVGGLPRRYLPGSRVRVVYHKDLVRFMQENNLGDPPDNQLSILAMPLEASAHHEPALSQLLSETLEDTKLILHPGFEDGMIIQERGGIIFREDTEVSYDPIRPYLSNHDQSDPLKEYQVAPGALVDALTHYFHKNIILRKNLFENGQDWKSALPHAVRRND